MKGYGEALPVYYPPPATTMSFAEVLETSKAGTEVDRIQYALYDSLRSIIAGNKSDKAGRIEKSLFEYADALNDLEKTAKDSLLRKAGRIFSQTNEAALREVKSMIDAAMAKVSALLSQVEDKGVPQGEANYPNVLDPDEERHPHAPEGGDTADLNEADPSAHAADGGVCAAREDAEDGQARLNPPVCATLAAAAGN